MLVQGGQPGEQRDVSKALGGGASYKMALKRAAPSMQADWSRMTRQKCPDPHSKNKTYPLSQTKLNSISMSMIE